MTEWLAQNWQYILTTLYIAEKIVKLTPTKYDDIVFDIIGSGLKKLIGK